MKPKFEKGDVVIQRYAHSLWRIGVITIRDHLGWFIENGDRKAGPFSDDELTFVGKIGDELKPILRG